MADLSHSSRVDLRADGVLWLINRTVFHPRGFALAVDVETGDLSLFGNGDEPWAYDLDEDECFAAVEALLERTRNGES